MSSGPAGRPDDSMTLITEMMQRPLDPGYAAAAQTRQSSGLPAATSLRSPLLIIVAVLIGALLGVSALTLRAPSTVSNNVKSDLVGRIESSRAHADAQTRLIASLRNQINTAQSSLLNQQSQGGLAALLARLELAAGTVGVTGPGLVVTVDDAPQTGVADAPAANPRDAAGPDQGKVIATDLQIVVNGLWDAGAEAISVNGHRLTSRSAIRGAGAATLVDYRPLTRPYVITAIGDPGSLAVEFADNSGGSYLQFMKSNNHIRGDVTTKTSVTVPGEPALSVQEARPVQSAATARSSATPSPTGRAPTDSATRPRASTPRTTETAP